MQRPNILWICTDQQRFDTLGCYGNPLVHTPNLDRLAASGTLFERAFCQNPLCTPSRASFLTGRYPRTTRTRQNGQSIPTDEKLVTRLLADADYRCGLAGKLHLSACAPKACPDLERRIDDGYSTFHWSHHPDGDWPSSEYNQWLAAQGIKYSRKSFRGSSYVETSMAPEYHQTSWCAEKAIDFIHAQANMEQPWLFSVNCYDPHHPFDPPEEYLQRYLDRLDEIPLPNYILGELEDKPGVQRTDHRGAYGGQRKLYPFNRMTKDDHRLIRAAYWAMCDLIDAQVGRMLEALESTGQRDNTLVVFMSDHGEMLGDHGFYLKGPFFYEPAVRVPLIISWPGVVQANQRSSALVELVDLAPTLLEACDQPVYGGMQGHSLWPLLTGKAPANHHRDDVYCEHYGTTHHKPGQTGAYATMVRTDRYKLVAIHGEKFGELYDLQRDAAETNNLWCDPAHQAIRMELLQRLCDRMAWTVDPLPQREAAF
ncbi:MAG TPA: sulfatase-like hydrolase/transferase [Abditibacteriaceae bacterium]|jgi:arylsulfatase A-like enzyme